MFRIQQWDDDPWIRKVYFQEILTEQTSFDLKMMVVSYFIRINHGKITQLLGEVE